MKHSLHLFALAAAGLLLTGTVPFVHSASDSPVGDWDFVLGGRQRGVALISFNPDSTIAGALIVRPIKPSLPSVPPFDPRNPTGASGRPGTTPPVSSNSSVTVSNFLGSTTLFGMWTYDFKGNVVGFLANRYEDLSQTSTNGPVYVTNSASFRGTARTGVRFNFNVFSGVGTVSYKGVPMIDLPDIDGDYFAETRRSGLASYDFFTLTQNLGGGLNTYDISNGNAGAFLFGGGAILSRQKQLAVVTLSGEEEPTLSAYVGPFSTTTRRGNLIGADNKPAYNIPFKIYPRP